MGGARQEEGGLDTLKHPLWGVDVVAGLAWPRSVEHRARRYRGLAVNLHDSAFRGRASRNVWDITWDRVRCRVGSW